MKAKILIPSGLLLLCLSAALTIALLPRQDASSPEVALETPPVDVLEDARPEGKKTSLFGAEENSAPALTLVDPEWSFTTIRPSPNGGLAPREHRLPAFTPLLDMAPPLEHPLKTVRHSGTFLPEAREPVLIRGDLQDVRPVTLLETRPETRHRVD